MFELYEKLAVLASNYKHQFSYYICHSVVLLTSLWEILLTV